jgi:hypothetical protein
MPNMDNLRLVAHPHFPAKSDMRLLIRNTLRSGLPAHNVATLPLILPYLKNLLESVSRLSFCLCSLSFLS